MDAILLTTKLRPPPPRRHLIRRSRLSDFLNREIEGSRLVVVAAPAGYGKTTLLAQWASAAPTPVAWLSLDGDDNDPDRFCRYLVAAWAEVQPRVSDGPLGLLVGGLEPDRDAVLAAFIALGGEHAHHTTFVIDDYHVIENPAIHQFMTALIDHLPPTLHLVLAGRAEPPVPLARYRAQTTVLEIRAGELQFKREETEQFLNVRMGLGLDADQIQALHEQLEGWAAGLQLASLTLQNRPRPGEPLVVGGRHRLIADFLAEDVLAHLPVAVRDFLLETSILDRLCGSLCDAVTGRNDGQDTLEFLERANLFLVPLDDDRTWFRYHHLFAGYLRADLNRRHPGRLTDLHGRAAHWYLAHGLPDPAFRHAVAGEDIPLVVEICERHLQEKLFGGEIGVVEGWHAAIPADWYAAFPELGLLQAAVLLVTGQFDACAQRLDEIERLARAKRAAGTAPLAKVTAVRCFLACFQNELAQAEDFAERALRDLPGADHSFRADIYHALGDTYRANGRWPEAEAHYLKALAAPQMPSFLLRSTHVHGALADLELRRGRLRAAAAHWEQALATMRQPGNWGRLPLPVTGWVYLRMAELHHEWNELAAAGGRLALGLERVELGGDARSLIAGHLIAMRLNLSRGELSAAASDLERARPLVEHAPYPDWTSRFERCQVELWLAQGRLDEAVAWAEAMLPEGDITLRPEGEAAQLGAVRVLIGSTDSSRNARALLLLERLLQSADEEGRLGVQIEALTLRAMALWESGDRAEAMIAFEHALRLAEPEGYQRLFLDLGRPVDRLLHEARSRGVMPGYVADLIAAWGADPGTPSGSVPLPEPLSAREREILSLIAAGLTNREIAERLTISAETVKKHTANIYGKLGVRHRTAAVAMARELDLLA